MRTDSRLGLVVLAVVAALAGVVWWATLGPEPGPAGVGVGEESPTATAERGAVDLADGGPGAPRLAGTGGAAERTAAFERDPDAPAPDADAGPRVVVRGRVVLPPGTPADERPVVLAVESRRTWIQLADGDGPLDRAFEAALAPERGEPSEPVDGLLAVAPTDPGGAFELSVPADAAVVHLAATGRYVYPLATTAVPTAGAAEAPVELTVALGGWLEGRLVAPLAEGDEEADLDGLEVELGPDVLSGFEVARLTLFGATREARTGDGGAFEFRGVPAEGAFGLAARAREHALGLELGLALAPGEHRRIELRLGRGAALAGRVVDESGEPVDGARVHARLRGALGDGIGAVRETTTGPDGAFELAAVAPGAVDLVAERTGRLETRLRVEPDLVEGERRTGLELVLTAGASLVGRVEFEGGAPAAGASVRAGMDLSRIGDPSAGAELARTRGGSATADEAGAFALTGLSDTSFALTATLAVEDGALAGSYSARRSGVRPGGEPVLLVLERLGALDGRVVDAASERPVERFAVHVTRKGSGAMLGIGADRRSKDFEDEDGAFSFDGLEPATWTVEVLAPGYGPSAPVEVALPRADGEEPFVVALAPAASVAGVVVDPRGAPVLGAEVAFVLGLAERIRAQETGGGVRAFTDAQGRFLLDDLAPGDVELVASAADWAASAPVAVELAAGRRVEGVRLELRLGGRIEGVVHDDEGGPARGLMVVVQDVPSYATQHVTESDGDGRFAVEGLEPGTWQVIAMPSTMRGDTDPGDPGTQAALLARMRMASVEVVDGETAHVVLGEPPAEPVDLTGRVVSAGSPVAGAMVSFVPERGTQDALSAMKIAVSDEDGRFALRLAGSGPYLATVQTGVAAGAQNSVEFLETVPAGSAVHEVVLELPGGGVAGTVRGPGGAPLADCRVSVTVEGGSAFGSVMGGNYAEVRTDEDGRYEVAFLRPGTYTVAAGGVPLGGLLETDSAGGRVARTGVEVEDGRWRRGVDFDLTAPVAMRGRVVDRFGAPVAGATVFVRDEAGAFVDRLSFVVSDASGRFEYRGLAPGSYRASARLGTEASAWCDPVRVDEGTPGEPELALGPGTVLRVQVVDDEERPQRVTVSVVDDDGQEHAGLLSLEVVLTDPSAAFSAEEQRVGPLPAGDYVVTATAADGRSRSRRVAVSGREERRVVLRLE